MSLKGLIFDSDGTLADTEETHRQAFNAAFLELGLGWDWSVRGYSELLRVSGGEARLRAHIDSLTASDADKARLRQLVPAIRRTKSRVYADLIAERRARLRPGVARLIREARAANLRLAIASTSVTSNVQALLSASLGPAGVRWFDALACAGDVRQFKPAPDVYRRALAMLRLSAGECVAFEDSENGLNAARSAGLCTVVTPTRWTLGQDFSGSSLQLSHLGDPEQPLPPAEQARVNAPWLGVAELERLLGAETVRRPPNVVGLERC